MILPHPPSLPAPTNSLTPLSLVQHGKICKPYNSVLGEHFRSHWDVVPAQAHPDPAQPPILRLNTSLEAAAAADASNISLTPGGAGETASVRSGMSASSAGTASVSKRYSNGKSPSTAATSLDADLAPQMSSLSLAEGAERVRVVYMTEQVSHHPPVSAYHACCPSRGLTLAGIDQISAKVSGTTLRVAPGTHNKGIYIRIEGKGDSREGTHGAGETYHITHPIASVNGILRGSFYLTVGDSTIVTCTGGKGDEWLRAVVEYKEEVRRLPPSTHNETDLRKQSWLGRAQYRMEGVVHAYKKGDTAHEAWTKVKDVPKARVIAEFDGCWRNRVRWRKVGASPAFTSTENANATPTETSQSSVKSGRSSKSSTSSAASAFEPTEYTTLLDLSTVYPIPKIVRPLDKQLPYESRKLWSEVTDRLVKKEFGEATKAKLSIEQRQRDQAAERKRTGAEYVFLFLCCASNDCL